jgi:hypothetical protein
MIIYKLARYKAFHGSPNKIDAFSIGFSGEGHDSNGPGIYFSSDESDASWYGDNLHEVELNFNKWVSVDGNVDWGEIEQLVLWESGLNSPEEFEDLDEDKFYDSNLSSWAEDASSAFYIFMEDMKNNSKGQLDAFLNIWINLYRYKVKDFLENMVKLGYDGAIVYNVNNTGVNHYIVYNENIISLLGKDNEIN